MAVNNFLSPLDKTRGLKKLLITVQLDLVNNNAMKKRGELPNEGYPISHKK